MTKVFAVIGESRAGKSATIRALTGAARSDIVKVKLTNGDIKEFFVQLRSLLEAKISLEEFVQKINAMKNGTYVLVALRPRAAHIEPDKFPDALKCIERFREEGWDVAGIVLLDRNRELSNKLREMCSNSLAIQNHKERSINEIAHQIRDEWGWL